MSDRDKMPTDDPVPLPEDFPYPFSEPLRKADPIIIVPLEPWPEPAPPYQDPEGE